jgi:hypothetical protein
MSGRQRLQGLSPAARAASGVVKNRVFSGFGRRDGHFGRQ